MIRDLAIFGNGGPPGRGPHHPDETREGLRESGERRALGMTLAADGAKDAAAWASVAKESGLTVVEIAELSGATRRAVYAWLD